MKSEREDRPLKKIAFFVLSWVVTGVFGIGTLVVLIGFATAVRQTDPKSVEAIANITLLLISALIFTVAWVALWPLKKKLFIKYTRWALLVGATLMWAILSLSLLTSIS